MAYVKLDVGILNSTLWMDRASREIFITALLMAEPKEFAEQVRQIKVRVIEETDFVAPAGWYGFVPAAGPGIVHRAGLEQEEGLAALERLGDADLGSRSAAFEGRRMIRIDGGYLMLNYVAYRDKDHTTAERSRRYRARKAEAKAGATRDGVDVTRDATCSSRTATHANEDANADVSQNHNPAAPLVLEADKDDPAGEIYKLYPRKEGKAAALKAIASALKRKPRDFLVERTTAYAAAVALWQLGDLRYVPHPATWFNEGRFDDDPANWKKQGQSPVKGRPTWA